MAVGFCRYSTPWNATYWPLDWHGLIAGFMSKGDGDYLADMQSEAFFNEQVKIAADKTRAYMKLLEECYEKAKKVLGQ